jgi:hypothetical protein
VNCDLGGGCTPLVHAIDMESDTAWQRHHEPDREPTDLTELLLAPGQCRPRRRSRSRVGIRTERR